MDSESYERISQERKPRICQFCVHYLDSGYQSDLGICRRYPPRVSTKHLHNSEEVRFSQVAEYDTCGEWCGREGFFYAQNITTSLID